MRFTGLSEFAVYGLLFAALILFNLWMQRRGRIARERRQQPEIEQAQPLPQPRPAPTEPLDASWGRAPQAERPVPAVSVQPVRRAPVPVARPPSTGYRAVFRSRHGMRLGVVAMTVLGPCRALEPYGTPSGPRPSPGPATRPEAIASGV